MDIIFLIVLIYIGVILRSIAVSAKTISVAYIIWAKGLEAEANPQVKVEQNFVDVKK